MEAQKYRIEDVEVISLGLNLENPRFIGMSFEDEEDMLKYLIEEADIDELLLSIINSGYLDFEPIIVKEDNVVLEGNRRVAALKLIRDSKLRDRLEVVLPSEPGEDARPDKIRAVIVKDHTEARNFIGFKHINGPRKWDAMSKAKYATDWFETGASLETISKSLGDTFNTVQRLVYGFRVYQQAVCDGFDPERRTARRLAFSHLYTAITRAPIRDWLELQEDPTSAPVPAQNSDKLAQLMSWLYGQGESEPALVKSQNPDLNRLANVMAHEHTRDVLIRTRDLNEAWEELEPRSARLETALTKAVRETETSLSLSGSFDGRENLFELGNRLFQGARTLFKSFRDYRDREKGLDDL